MKCGTISTLYYWLPSKSRNQSSVPLERQAEPWAPHAKGWLQSSEVVHDMTVNAHSSSWTPLSNNAPEGCKDGQLRWQSTSEKFTIFRRKSSPGDEQEAGLQRHAIEVLEERLYLMWIPSPPLARTASRWTRFSSLLRLHTLLLRAMAATLAF